VSHAIEIDSLEVRFGARVAVADVSLRVDFGEIAVMLGPNGAGKTTTVETLLGFRRPTSGQVRVAGLDPRRDHAEVVTRTGALLQRGGVWSAMSAREVLTLSATYYAAPRAVGELLEMLQLTGVARTPWRRLSGGEQQRTLLALALLGRPRVLVLDEPSSAVDPEGHRVVRELLAAERNRGCALLVTTHELADAEALASHVSIIDAGRVVAQGTLEELAGEPVLVIESSLALDPRELARRLGGPVEEEAPQRYRCAVANTPERLAALTGYLEELGGRLTSLRSRASLEERYLELVARERTESRP
jgi:ABC-2 type transport system ATP-binding protein